MDLSAFSTFGITGTLVLVIAYLLASNHRDRTTYERALTMRDAEHNAELAAARAAHAEDLSGLRSRLSPSNAASASSKPSWTPNATAAAPQKTPPPACCAARDPGRATRRAPAPGPVSGHQPHREPLEVAHACPKPQPNPRPTRCPPRSS